MANLSINVLKEVSVDFLHVKAGVRYWEDSEVDGVEDTNGDLIPCRRGGLWCPLIDLHEGKIVNWEKGKSASIHYKVCDNGVYSLLNKQNEEVKALRDEYVPSLLCPKENGYGDYIIMDIDEQGNIDGFVANLEEFDTSEED